MVYVSGRLHGGWTTGGPGCVEASSPYVIKPPNIPEGGVAAINDDEPVEITCSTCNPGPVGPDNATYFGINGKTTEARVVTGSANSDHTDIATEVNCCNRSVHCDVSVGTFGSWSTFHDEVECNNR